MRSHVLYTCRYLLSSCTYQCSTSLVPRLPCIGTCTSKLCGRGEAVIFIHRETLIVCGGSKRFQREKGVRAAGNLLHVSCCGGEGRGGEYHKHWALNASTLLLKDMATYTCIVNYAMCRGTSMICLRPLSPFYLLSTLYVTHMIKYSRPSTAFLYCKWWKAGRGLGTRLDNHCSQGGHHFFMCLWMQLTFTN